MAWLACGVGAVLVVMATSLNRRHAGQIVRASAVLLLVVAGTVPLWSTLARSFTLERSGSGFDVIAELYRVAFNMIAAHPLDGVGINNFSFVMTQYDRTGIAMFIAAPVHNLYVLTLAEMGPLGLMGLIAVIAVPAAALWRARRRLDHEGRCIVAGLLGGLLVFLLLGVTGWTYYIIQAPVWFFVGMALAASRLPRFADASAIRSFAEEKRV
jgi:O-antigen ligase